MITTSLHSRLLALALTTATVMSSATACTPPDPASQLQDDGVPDVVLAPSSVASVGDQQIGWNELDRYISTLYARQPIGDETLRQIVTERIVEREAGRLGLEISNDDVSLGLARLDAEARERTGQGLHESLDAAVADSDLRAGMRTLLELEAIVRADKQLPEGEPVDPVVLSAWLEPFVDSAGIQERPLDDPIAAVWSGGEITREEVGRRVRSILQLDELHGIVSEMLGIVVVRNEAARRGIALTQTAATEEILERDALLKRHEELANTSYADFIQASQKRSLAELLASEKFATEVLLRLFVEDDYDDAAVRAFHDAERGLFVQRYGDQPFEDIAHLVRKELRERVYRKLYEAATIQRRL